MGEALICEKALSPESISINNEEMCCDCDYRLGKD